MRFKSILTVILALIIGGAFFIFFEKKGEAQEIQIADLKISNQTLSSVNISFVTNLPVSQVKIKYGKTKPPSEGEVTKNYSTPKDIHYFEIINLETDTLYYFEIIVDGKVFDNSNNFYTFRTTRDGGFPSLSFPVWGRVLKDTLPVEGAVVYLKIKRGQSESYYLSSLSDSNGYFFVDLANARDKATGDYFNFLQGDLLSIWIQGGSLGTAQGEDTVASSSPQALGDFYLSFSDIFPPQGSIQILSGALASKSKWVSLFIEATDNVEVSAFKLSNNGKKWTGWIKWPSGKRSFLFDWGLCISSFGGVAGGGIKTVYVKFKDSAGNISQIYSDSILYERASPFGKILIRGGLRATRNKFTFVRLTAQDRGENGAVSGVSAFKLSNNGKKWTGWIKWPSGKATINFPWNLTNSSFGGIAGGGIKRVYAKFKDNAGNVSSVVSDTIFYDRISPGGKIIIQNGASRTFSKYVTLTLIGKDNLSGIYAFRLSNNGKKWTSWIRWPWKMRKEGILKKKWDLTKSSFGGSLSFGEKKVYFQLKDFAGNLSRIYIDKIIYTSR